VLVFCLFFRLRKNFEKKKKNLEKKEKKQTDGMKTQEGSRREQHILHTHFV